MNNALKSNMYAHLYGAKLPFWRLVLARVTEALRGVPKQEHHNNPAVTLAYGRAKDAYWSRQVPGWGSYRDFTLSQEYRDFALFRRDTLNGRA